MGNDTTIGMAASQGHLELNAFMPVIIYNYLDSLNLLADVMASFNKNCVSGIVPNREKIGEYLENSLMLVTALSPMIGYEKAAEIAKKAYNEGLTLKEAALATGYITEEDFDSAMNPSNMV